MSSSQIINLNPNEFDNIEQLQTYIKEIQSIKNTNYGTFDALQIQEYSNAVKDLEPTQAALLLHTQGLTNAQIAETLAVKNGTREKACQAMAEAGLLKSKVSLTNAQLRDNLHTILGKDADISAAAASLGLSAALKAEETQTVKLTKKKLLQAVQTKALNKAQAEEIAAMSGITIAQNTQTASSMPAWIARMKAMTIATWDQVKATGAWLISSPAGWCAIAAGGILLLNKAIQSSIKTLEEQKTALENVKETISGYDNEISAIQSKLEELNGKINELGGKPLTIVDQKTLSVLQDQKSELQQQLELLQALNAEAKDIAKNTTIEILDNTAKITGLTKTFNELKELDFFGALTATDGGLGGFINAAKKIKDGDYLGAFTSAWQGINNIPYLNFLYPKKEKDKSIIEETTEQIQDLSDLRNDLDQLNSSRGSISEDSYHKKLSKINEKISDQTTALLANIQTLQTYKSQLDETDELQADYIKKIQAVEDAYTASLINKDGFRTFEDILSSSVYGSSKDSLIELANQGKLTAEVLDEEYHNISVLFQALGFSIDDVVEKLKLMGTKTAETIDAEPPNLSSALSSNKEAIDTYQSKLNTIKESLSNLSSVAADSSAQLDLLQTLLDLEPAFDLQMYKNADGTIRFEEALKALLIQLKNDALKAMPKQLEGYITDMANRVLYASSSFPSLSDAMSSMDSGFTLLSDVNAEVEKTGTLSEETLKKIIGKYSNLEPLVFDYLNGMASEQDILNALTQAYDNDLSNYKQYYAAKHIQDTDFYKKVVSNMGEDVKEKAKAYGVDLKNYASILALKQNLEQDFLNKSTADHEGLPEQRRGKDILQALLAKRDAKKVLEGLDEAINASVSDYTPSYTTSSISPSSSSATQFSEQIDFTKYKLEELEQEIDRLRKKADNAAEAGRKSHTIDQILSVTQEKKEALLGILKLYQKEADTLLASIPANYQDIAKNGAIAIESFVGASNEKVVSAIKEYRTMAGSVSDVNSQLLELNTTVQSLKLEKFNHLKTEYENQFGILSSFISQFKAQIDLFGSQGYPVSEKLYSQMMEKTSWQIEMLKKEREALVKQMSEIIKSTPDLSKDSFYEMANAITGIDSQITDCIASLEEFNNQIRDIPWNQFNRVIDGLESLGGELSGLENLLGSYDLTIDGEFSDYGLAQLGILAQQYELANYQTQQYAEAIEELDREYQSGKWSALEYSEKLQELVSAQWNSVSSATSAQKAILDLAKSRVDSEISSIDKAVDAYEELIQAQVKELKAEKELHDFRKSIEDQQSTITSLEKQLAAIQNDTSNAAQAKRAQLEDQLKNARDELDEMYYEQSIRDKEDALNEELERYKQLQEEKKKELEASLEDEDKLIGDYLGLANANASAIADILEELAREHGIKISDSIIDPWKSGEDAVTDYKGALKHASGSFKDSLDGIRESILSMTASADTLAQSFLEMFHVNTSAFLKDLTDIANLLNLISGEADKTTQHTGEWRYDKDKINSQNGNGSWWYEHTDGSYTKGGWEKIDGKWYYFDPEGWMKTGWHQDKDGSWYYLSDGSIGKEGEMLTDTATPDGYYVDSSGKWSQSAGAARRASLPAAFSQEDGIATVQPGEAVLYGNYSQLLKAAPASLISLALPRQNSCLPGQIQSISGDSYTIDNKVIVQGSVSTENMDRIISVMDKRVDLGFKKAYDKKCLKGRAFR